MEKEENKDLGILLVAGLGIGGYFLWKYFKPGPEDVEKGFNISQVRWEPIHPFEGQQITITVLGKNNTETGDCFCRMIKDAQEIFYSHEIVEGGGIKSFICDLTMPRILNLRVETGKIIEGIEELHSFQEFEIPSVRMLRINSTQFSQLIN